MEPLDEKIKTAFDFITPRNYNDFDSYIANTFSGN